MLRALSAAARRARGFSTFASVDGVAADATKISCSVWDTTFQRGDGVFEVVRVVGDRDGSPVPRAVHLHLDRLERSAAAIKLPLPPRADVERILRDAAAGGGHGGMVRLMVTRGGGSPGYGDHLGAALDAPPKTFALWQPTTLHDSRTLCPLVAPWHPAGFEPERWATIKWLAYGANVHSKRLAAAAGFDDAVLLGRGWGADDAGPLEDKVVLDGPNFAVLWLKGGVVHAPSWRELGMLESVTSALALEAAAAAGYEVREGVHRLSSLLDADEAYVLSTSSDLTPVTKVGDEALLSAADSEHRVRLLAGIDARLATFE